MSSLTLSSNPLLDLWRSFHSRLRFKFILPRKRTATLAGIKLDISSLSPLMKNIILTGRYESQERSLAAKALTKSDVVLELGGAIGFIGLYCRRMIGVKHHFSVEANPSTLEQLRRNYTLNRLQPHVIHAAAAAEDGEIELDVGGEFWENTVVAGNGAQTIKVPALSLSSLVAKMPASPTALVCDIEGAEQYLRFDQLPSTVTKIILELHPSMIGEDQVSRIVSELSWLGFNQVRVEDGTSLFIRPASTLKTVLAC
jgi:FkbM family methyltransferase